MKTDQIVTYGLHMRAKVRWLQNHFYVKRDENEKRE